MSGRPSGGEAPRDWRWRLLRLVRRGGAWRCCRRRSGTYQNGVRFWALDRWEIQIQKSTQKGG